MIEYKAQHANGSGLPCPKIASLLRIDQAYVAIMSMCNLAMVNMIIG
jgi:hypothetical protein